MEVLTMPWSPPKKITIIISLILEILGLFLSLVALGYIFIESFSLGPEFALVGTILCFVGWILMVIGALFKGI
jgi:hypothetical protein